MTSNLRTLGPSESKVVLSLLEQDREVVTASEVLDQLESETTARKVIRNLLRKGWLTRIVGGRYMLLPPKHGPENLGENNALALAAAAVEPSYVGWWSAAAFHGFTTQRPMTVFVAALKQVPSRTIEGTAVRFVKTTSRKFFGSLEYDIYGRKVAISSPEKTVVDCLDRPDLCGGPAELARIVHTALETADLNAIVETAFKMQSRAVLQRLGFLAELVGLPLPDDLRTAVRAAIPSSTRASFGRQEKREGDIGYAAPWGLLVHARRDELLAEVPQRRGSG